MSDLEARLLAEIERIQFVDPHSHIQPRTPAARSLDDLLGYHYYTELAHSTGMGHEPLGPNFPPRERVRRLLAQSTHFRNTVQYSWLVAIARYFLGWTDTLGPEQSDALWDRAETLMAQPDWEKQLLNRTGVEQIFLTNDFDDDLTGFDSRRYVPCLRTDELVFRGTEPRVRDRLAAVTGVEPIGLAGWRRAIAALFERFIRHGAAYCAVSLPPDFEPQPLPEAELDRLLQPDQPASRQRSVGVFWELARACAECGLPFALMIGVHRQVYRAGVYQGQDLFDQRTSLHAFAELFNAFPGVRFCVSVLSSPQNQELASYSWIFPNVVPFGHWWYANAPAYIEPDLRARLDVVPYVKQLGYYSDAYKLEFIWPKVAMYRRCLARVLARHFVIERHGSEDEALNLARALLRDNARQMFRLGERTPSDVPS